MKNSGKSKSEFGSVSFFSAGKMDGKCRIGKSGVVKGLADWWKSVW